MPRVCPTIPYGYPVFIIKRTLFAAGDSLLVVCCQALYMLDPLSLAGTAIDAISLGIQIAQVLQIQLDQLHNADERLVQIVFEIRATAAGLANLQEVLDCENKSYGRKSLTDKDQADIKAVVSRCNHIFRSIVILLAKPGKEAVLTQVNEFQRRIEQQRNGRRNENPTLDIELSSMEHLVMF